MTFTQDELEKIRTKKDKTIHVEHFAKMAEIDTILFELYIRCRRESIQVKLSRKRF